MVICIYVCRRKVLNPIKNLLFRAWRFWLMFVDTMGQEYSWDMLGPKFKTCCRAPNCDWPIHISAGHSGMWDYLSPYHWNIVGHGTSPCLLTFDATCGWVDPLHPKRDESKAFHLFWGSTYPWYPWYPWTYPWTYTCLIQCNTCSTCTNIYFAGHQTRPRLRRQVRDMLEALKSQGSEIVICTKAGRIWRSRLALLDVLWSKEMTDLMCSRSQH